MITPIGNRFEGWYYDGLTPLRHPVTIYLTAATLEIVREGQDSLVWRHAEVRILATFAEGDPVRLERTGAQPGESLLVPSGQFLDAVRQYVPDSQRRMDSSLRLSGWPAVLIVCLIIPALAAALYFWGVRWAADTAARFTPVPVEERLGRAVVNVLAPPRDRCVNPGREQLLARLAARLTATVPRSVYTFRILYSNNSMVNAFAAPGGYIVVFRGLIEEAQTPEELAAVLAHEMQHVLHRHTTRALARELSGRTLLTLLSVDSSGTPAALEGAAQLFNLSYQRSDEEEADTDSVAMLVRARIRPDGLATLLRRLQLNHAAFDPALTYLSSHPAILERAANVTAKAGQAPSSAQPLMTAEEWAAARAVCALPDAR